MTRRCKGDGKLEEGQGKGPDKNRDSNQKTPRVTWEDVKFLIAMTVVTIGFSVRTGEFPGALWATLRQVFVSIFYGFGTVFLFIGLTKKIFKYEATWVHIVKWAFALAALFAVSELMHEVFMVLTGQMPRPH